MPPSTDAEIIRHSIRDQLYHRHPAPMTPAGLLRAVTVDVGFCPAPVDIAGALADLKDLGQATVEPDALGNTEWWRLTAAGRFAKERGQ